MGQPKRAVNLAPKSSQASPEDPFDDIIPAQPRRAGEPKLFVLRGDGPPVSQIILDDR